MLSNNTTENVEPMSSQPVGVIIFVILLLVIGIVNLVGNVLVVQTILRHETLRQPCNDFVVSLAISDFGATVFFLVYILGQLEQLHITIITGTKLSCVTLITLLQWFEMTSSYHLVAITATRFIGTIRPLLYNTYLTERRSRIAVSIIWFVAGWISVALYVTDLDNEVNICRLELVYDRTRVILLAFFTVVIPMAIMIILYCAMIRIAHRKIQCSTVVFAIAQRIHGSHVLFKEMKSTMMVSLLVGFFTLTWTPLLSLMFYTTLCGCVTSPSVSMIFRLIVFTNYGINIFIYAGRLEQFRNHLRNDIKKCFHIISRHNYR